MGNGTSSTGLVVADQGFLPATAPATWQGMAAARPEILRNPFDPNWLLHSFRRRWILATGLGLLTGALMAALVWWAAPAKLTAIALLELASVKPSEDYDLTKSRGRTEDFDTYRASQLSKIKSHYVLSSALRQQGIAELASVKAEQSAPAAWLQSELEVVFAEREGELMRVSLKLENGNDAKLLVDAVIDAYIEDVVLEEKLNRKRTLGQLKDAHKTIMDQVKRDKEDYRNLAKQYGASESEYASVDRELAFAQLHLLRKERETLNMRKMDVELALQLLKVAGNDDARIGAAVSEQMASDPKIQYLQSRQMNIEARLTEERMRAKRQDAPSIQRMLTERQQVAQEIASAQADLRRQAQAAMAGSPNTEYKNMVKGQKLQKKHYEVQITEIDRKFDSVQQQIRELAEENLDLAMRKGALDERQQVGNDLASKIAGLDIQLGAPARVRVFQRATVMDGLDLFQRAVLVGLGGLFGLCATALGIAYLDFRRRPLNGPDQIDDGLGIRVVGSLPPLAFRKVSDESDPMLALLMESIDSVRTALMHTDTSQETRVVLVTSALGHEGRSTVASQLAASLARAGRRTLLVDGDVRHPTLHRLFDFPIEDGFCEVLRGDVDVADVVRPTHAESLWLLTAGYCDARAIQALAKDQVQPIFDKLRDEYDFVIIDSAPVLKLSDSLILGQYCDGAILSVLRDVSQVAKVHEANDLLRSVGIRVIGSVVNGVREKPDDRISPLLLATAAATEFAEEEVEAE